jgi:hypothetical protein
MSAEAIHTHYTEVAHLGSFWGAVFSFMELQEAEGRHVVAALMTDCIMTDAILSHGDAAEFEPRATPLQEQAFQALQTFLVDPALTPAGLRVGFEAVWVTASR